MKRLRDQIWILNYAIIEKLPAALSNLYEGKILSCVGIKPL